MTDSESFKSIDSEQLYEIYFDRIYKFVSHRILHKEDAEDLSAEVFMRLSEKLNSYDSTKGTLDTWVFRITRNMITDYYRKSNVKETCSIYDFANFIKFEKHVEENIEKQEEYEYLEKAVRSLSDKEQEIISMKFGAGLGNKEISELMDIGYSNVTVILHRAIKKIRKRLEEYYGE
ncbi:RNA polymerase sigma factor [Peptoniphilus indolicus]|uniref:ECF family DNA-directed RNA polymerase sigma subunit SigX n=2 Tax=Peptoniphilus indolicus TaxID=33030 RepID=G4D4P0_9FIRM|nr:sigma-70 family RNA polymerase sigma factor [Peptoniphilus indolicus]EGY79498.1 ECF family DNA-directed RNA polymerase sigma subunit SigX [Peptoniphilus indolicus ATCC 29427]SUB74672.1 RNA polymerase sigma factor sigM [Peptoniphilus indolicus]